MSGRKGGPWSRRARLGLIAVLAFGAGGCVGPGLEPPGETSSSTKNTMGGMVLPPPTGASMGNAGGGQAAIGSAGTSGSAGSAAAAADAGVRGSAGTTAAGGTGGRPELDAGPGPDAGLEEDAGSLKP